MNYRLIYTTPYPFLECLPDGGLIRSEQDALDWLALCGEHGTDRLIIHSSNLTDDFFDLSSGLAGAILLKFAIYRIKVAAVLTPEQVNRGKFREMALETNRGRVFRIFYDRSAAEAWLGSAPH